ncbi:hypothetical protein [Halorussus halophilus]|uniref:hypothetical protein n=1 Tax=Halorussus halophilus TaxID=2650975 RepID=UPI001300CA70|nr:hypothetical protein [Halorussus halophilus]
MTDEENTERPREDEQQTCIECLTTDLTSRRAVLRWSASAVAGGSLLTATGAARAQDGPPLNVETTDAEVLSRDRAKTRGRIGGMDRVDSRRCKVGAQVARIGEDDWYGGFHSVVTGATSIRVAVTLTGFGTEKYKCRLIACPVTHTRTCYGNALTLDFRRYGEEKRSKKKHDEKRRDRCECKGDEDREKHHVTFCGGGGSTVLDYQFAVSGDHIEKSAKSCAPDAIDHRWITVDSEDCIDGNVVTGAVAGGGDSFRFTGELTDLRCDDGVHVYLDGHEFDR